MSLWGWSLHKWLKWGGGCLQCPTATSSSTLCMPFHWEEQPGKGDKMLQLPLHRPYEWYDIIKYKPSKLNFYLSFSLSLWQEFPGTATAGNVTLTDHSISYQFQVTAAIMNGQTLNEGDRSSITTGTILFVPEPGKVLVLSCCALYVILHCYSQDYQLLQM